MSNVLSFPGLGLEFHLNRVAFQILGKDIYWYGIIIAVGFLLAAWYGCSRASGFGLDEDKVFDMLFVSVPAAIIGARIYYVIFYMDLYRDADGTFRWGDAIAIWDGGLAIYGGLIAAILGALVYCKVRKQDFWSYGDCGAFGFFIGQSIGRWGNFVNIEAYGSVTSLPWRMSSPSIAWELLSSGQIDDAVYTQILDGTLGVHPTFLYESLWNLLGLVLLILWARKGRKFNGQYFLSYIVWYGFGRSLIEGLRTDSLYFFGTGIRTSQMVGIVSMMFGIVMFLIRLKTAGPATPAIPKKNSKAKEESDDGCDNH